MTSANTTEQQPTTWWKIEGWGARIVPVLVVKETEKSLWIKVEWRSRDNVAETLTSQHKKSDKYHKTWEAAHLKLLEQANENVERQKRELNRARSELGEIVKMKPPATTPRAHS